MKRAIFWLWLPLALSMTLMMLEGPTVQGAIARLPGPALSLAAFGTMFGIVLIIESPVIMFVSTAIALVDDAQSYYTLRRFVITVNLILTLLTALVAWTPLFALITGDLLGLPSPIVAAGRPMLQLMVFFTAAVGWRRFYQGILVRYGHTRRVTYGTAMRLLSNVVTAVALVAWGRLSGAATGALVLMAGVLVEAVVIYAMAIGVVRSQVLTAISEGAPLNMARIVRFHTPLAATSLLSFLAQPLTAAALARLLQPQATLAAWPVIFSVLLILRGWGLALQEITIFQARDPERRHPLRDFSLIVAGTTSLAALLISFTPLLDIYLRRDHWPRARAGAVCTRRCATGVRNSRADRADQLAARPRGRHRLDRHHLSRHADQSRGQRPGFDDWRRAQAARHSRGRLGAERSVDHRACLPPTPRPAGRAA